MSGLRLFYFEERPEDKTLLMDPRGPQNNAELWTAKHKETAKREEQLLNNIIFGTAWRNKGNWQHILKIKKKRIMQEMTEHNLLQIGTLTS
jgi:hypothetical protein